MSEEKKVMGMSPLAFFTGLMFILVLSGIAIAKLNKVNWNTTETP